MLVTLICDHRVLDGALAARSLAQLEAALCGPIAQELATLTANRAAA
jgi:pyruvate/2-oxoglutarate dehydrogenase complex dihydrolipoamide acyltransferase (E2) component